VVELALGLLVLVTILVAGIHFAEYGFLWVKLEETANFALFDETNVEMHSTAADSWDKWFAGSPGGAVTALNKRVEKRYRDFNGLSSADHSPTVTQVFTRASTLKVSCERYSGPKVEIDPADDPGGGARATFDGAFKAASDENAGVVCQVGASLSRYHFPEHFADGADGKFFQVKTVASAAIASTACAAGRPSGGDCTGRGYRMVLDDWGFQGASEAGQCPLSSSGCAANPGYWRMAKGMFDASGGSSGADGTALAQTIIGFSPADETKFWMSFVGGEGVGHGPFTDFHTSDGSTEWPTTPYNDPNSVQTYKPAYDSNDKCFLGWDC
jgi:hypothetical protein